jgi:hypothetical protein
MFSCLFASSSMNRFIARRCKSVISISVLAFIKLASASALATRFICHGSKTPPTAEDTFFIKVSAGLDSSPRFTSEVDLSSDIIV